MAPDPTHTQSPSADGPGPATLACRGQNAAPLAPTHRPRTTGLVLHHDCWFLSGPTAVGKSALAIDLAGRLGAEIVSVDSMAVYRGLDIGTAKPTPQEQARAPHHVIDVVAPNESYSVARWLADAGRAVDAIRLRGNKILFVGGTPLYFRSVRDGLALLPEGDPELRCELLAEAARSSPLALHAKLATIDPRAAARLHPNDTRRIVRALEVAQTTGRTLSESFSPSPHPVFATQMMILDISRRLLIARIEQRVTEMFSRGLVEEVQAASALPGGIGPTARQGAGYAESLDLLAGRIALPEAIRRTQQRTRQLAKRQLTWLRSFQDAVWITA